MLVSDSTSLVSWHLCRKHLPLSVLVCDNHIQLRGSFSVESHPLLSGHPERTFHMQCPLTLLTHPHLGKAWPWRPQPQGDGGKPNTQRGFMPDPQAVLEGNWMLEKREESRRGSVRRVGGGKTELMAFPCLCLLPFRVEDHLPTW